MLQNRHKPKIVLPYELLSQEQLFMMTVDKVLDNAEGITGLIASARTTIRRVKPHAAWKQSATQSRLKL